MSKFSVGDRVRVYELRDDEGKNLRELADNGEVIEAFPDGLLKVKFSYPTNIRLAIVHPNWCRRLVKRQRRRVWLSEATLVPGVENVITRRLENLAYCSAKDNREHAKANRLYHSGERCSWAKLNEETVSLIRRANRVGMSQMQLARAFKVDKKAIQKILRGKTWAT